MLIRIRKTRYSFKDVLQCCLCIGKGRLIALILSACTCSRVEITCECGNDIDLAKRLDLSASGHFRPDVFICCCDRKACVRTGHDCLSLRTSIRTDSNISAGKNSACHRCPCLAADRDDRIGCVRSLRKGGFGRTDDAADCLCQDVAGGDEVCIFTNCNDCFRQCDQAVKRSLRIACREHRDHCVRKRFDTSGSSLDFSVDQDTRRQRFEGKDLLSVGGDQSIPVDLRGRIRRE